MKTMNLIDLMKWRYATKKMDPSKVVPEDKVERILEATRLTASSSGLQPYDVLVVTNPELRQQIQAAANNQAQITEGSHVLVFAAWDDYTPERITAMFDLMAKERGGYSDAAIAYRDRLLQTAPARGAQANFEHAARQAYIGLGTAMIAAAAEGVDATPMEGFVPAKVDEILGLKAKGLRSVILLPLGYRESGKDWLEKLPKVRRALSDWLTEFK
jgi:nitroreductase / dihydropteridine reductase